MSTSELPDLTTPVPISRLQLPHFQFNLNPNSLQQFQQQHSHHHHHHHHHHGGYQHPRHIAGTGQVAAAGAAMGSDSVFD